MRVNFIRGYGRRARARMAHMRGMGGSFSFEPIVESEESGFEDDRVEVIFDEASYAAFAGRHKLIPLAELRAALGSKAEADAALLAHYGRAGDGAPSDPFKVKFHEYIGSRPGESGVRLDFEGGGSIYIGQEVVRLQCNSDLSPALNALRGFPGGEVVTFAFTPAGGGWRAIEPKLSEQPLTEVVSLIEDPSKLSSEEHDDDALGDDEE